MQYSELDLEVRIAAFAWLSQQVEIHGDVLPRTLLQQGFRFRGERVPLISPKGIFKPKILDLPLTITTTPDSPYEDSFASDSYLLYKYRGTDSSHPDNVGLRTAFQQELPLVYFHGIIPGRYLAVWPVFIIGDDPKALTYTIAVDDLGVFSTMGLQTGKNDEDMGRRAYIITSTKIRLHQRSFREKVLEAYRSQCTLCRLKHRELLDAAHIIPDHEPDSQSTVNHGMALCKLHHAAFDSFILGVTPDYIIRIRHDILEESDGPLLEFGLQQFEDQKILLPDRMEYWPNQDALAWKYQRFLDAEG